MNQLRYLLGSRSSNIVSAILLVLLVSISCLDAQQVVDVVYFGGEEANVTRRVMYPQQSTPTGFSVITVKPTGQWNTIVLPMDFSDLPGYPNPSGQAGLQSFYGTGGALDRFFGDMSQTALSMTATVTPLIRSSHTVAYYATVGSAVTELLNEALLAAQTLGFTISKYNQFVVVTSALGAPFLYSAASLSGIAGCHSNGQDTSSSASFAAIAQAFGQNMGLQQSNYRRASDGAIISNGNTLAVMGNAAGNLNPHIVPHDKLFLGWYQNDVDVILANCQNGVYRIRAHDHPSSYGHRALRLGFTYQSQSFYLEYRYFNGFGQLSPNIYPSSSAGLTSSLVPGALVTYEPTGASGSVLLDANPATSQANALRAPVSVGSSYNINVNGVTTGQTYATVTVVGQGGSAENSYVDVKLAFPSTLLCPFSASGTDLCTRDLCSSEPTGTFPSVVVLTTSQYASNLVIPVGQQLLGLTSLTFTLLSGSITSITVSLMNSANGNPGSVIASQTVSASTNTVTFASGSALHQLSSALPAGTYWVGYVITGNPSSPPSFKFSSIAPDNVYTQIQNSDGSWRSTLRELQLSVQYACSAVLMDPTALVVHQVPSASIRRGYVFHVIVAYQNSGTLPQRPTTARTLTCTLVAVTGSGTLTGTTTSWPAPTYSAYVTLSGLIISGAGQYQLTISDGTLTVTTVTLTVIAPTSTASMIVASPTGSVSIAVQQSLPQTIALNVLNSFGEVDTTATGSSIVASTTASGVSLQNSASLTQQGSASFVSLQLAACTSLTTIPLTFTLNTSNGPSVTVQAIVATSTACTGSNTPTDTPTNAPTNAPANAPGLSSLSQSTSLSTTYIIIIIVVVICVLFALLILVVVLIRRRRDHKRVYPEVPTDCQPEEMSPSVMKINA